MAQVKRHYNRFYLHNRDKRCDCRYCTKQRATTATKCGWFLLCKEPAVTTTDHPILGAVPVCAKHKQFSEEY